MSLHVQTWGSGSPVIALHPLALESTVFAGAAALLDERGFRTLAVDLPGFGQTPVGNEPLTAARLAKPIVELARGLERPPIVLGMSLGARVALEAALAEPRAFRGLALAVPSLPWTEHRGWLSVGHLLSPGLSERLPLQWGWPLLKWLSVRLDASERLEHDWLARASVRVAYYLSCPATRRHFVSASRELLLEPGTGPGSLWERMESLEVPMTFLWAAQDWLIPSSHSAQVARRFPRARQMRLDCCGHFVNGRHFRCFDRALTTAVLSVAEEVSTTPRVTALECVAEKDSRGTMRRLSGEDSVFIHAETATMPMHTMGTMILDPSNTGSFDMKRVVRRIGERVHLMPPYRQRLLEVPFALDRPVFVDDPEFRVENHIRRMRLAPPGTLRDLAREVERIAAVPLDRSRPLWEMWYAEGLEGGRVALVTKMHHCLLDGASGASQIAGLLDLEPNPENAGEVPTWKPEPLPSRLGLAVKALVPRIPNPVRTTSLVVDTIVGLVRRAAVRRQRSSTWDVATSFFKGAPRTRFTTVITPNRAVAYGSARLEDVKLVKNAFGVTVNDVILGACAIALRDYLEKRNDLPREPLLCAVPISMKSDEEKKEFSNKVATMPVKLRTDLDDPEALLRSVHEETEAAKREFFAVESDLLMSWLDLAPSAVMGAGARAYSGLGLASWMPSVANLIVSNMVGPPVPLFMAGARVEAIYPMGPVGEGTGLNITVLSNMDRIDVGLLACKDTVPGLWEIADAFEAAIRALTVAAKERAAA